jgi:uncharacterized protein (TIGR03790 family)
MRLTHLQKTAVAILLLLLISRELWALEPNEILVIVNGDVESSAEIGRYYLQRRNVPKDNILSLPLGQTVADTINRDDYDRYIAGPIRKNLVDRGPARTIKCLLTTYGIPYKVGPRGQLKNMEQRLAQLKTELNQYEIKLAGESDAGKQKKINLELKKTQQEIDRILGTETQASVDSELSMVLFDDYELHRWQPNQLYKNSSYPAELAMTMMVCRLDGPTPQIAQGLIDKAIRAENTGLHGVAYIDSRGIADDKQAGSLGNFDQQVRDLAVLLRFLSKLEVVEERTEKLFEPGCCPRTAIYCGWYRLKGFVDSFDFVDGAIGYHIASWEAIDLRDANSTEWCPALLTHGVTATLGAVAEPYLHAFPKPNDFFLELLHGKCLVEAFYHTQPFCSWQLILIGDPLYRPFKSGFGKG